MPVLTLESRFPPGIIAARWKWISVKWSRKAVLFVLKKLAGDISQKIKNVIPVLPTALMAEIILNNKQEWKSELELKADAVKRISELERQGAPIKISASACEGVLSAALNMLEGRGFVASKNNLYRADEDAIELLSYYANSIVHWK